LKALITGFRGQDGTYLAEELRAHGREVIGFTRSESGNLDAGRIHSVDYRDGRALGDLLDEIRPEEIYHLASPSCIRDTLEYEKEILAICVDTTLIFLRWITDRSPATRFFFAGSAEIYGDPVVSPQNESTPCHPENPYAVAKLTGRELCATFRKTHGVFASSGILFNHESPLRRADFVTRRITQGVAAIVAGESRELVLGNLDALRDWSHAADFARAFRLTLEASHADDFVFASGKNHSVREFCEEAFAAAGLDFRDYVRVDPAFYRPDFAQARLGDSRKALRELAWKPKIGFKELVDEMLRHDLEVVRR
jgi:GDPmannose 4,6-dehydratase